MGRLALLFRFSISVIGAVALTDTSAAVQLPGQLEKHKAKSKKKRKRKKNNTTTTTKPITKSSANTHCSI
jgi:hypothetical protein